MTLFVLSSSIARYLFLVFFFFNDTATTEIYTLSLHDALPISRRERREQSHRSDLNRRPLDYETASPVRSEEHTSELQSQSNLVCRLLLEKKKNTKHQRLTGDKASYHSDDVTYHLRLQNTL